MERTNDGRETTVAAPVPVLDDLKEWGSFAPGLDRMHGVLAALRKPHRHYRHMLVGGTNGKGTVATNIARHLPGTVGLFLSPHLIDVRERITINGHWLDDDLWRTAYQKVLGAIPGVKLSYFEWLTVLACVMFHMEKVDWVVFEVGLGGRWDAVNALDPELSVLTGVALDHTELLGDTVEKIALEKIEIARQGRPLVLPRSLLALAKVTDRLRASGCLTVPFEDSGGFGDTRSAVVTTLRTLDITTSLDRWILPPGRRERVPGYPGLFLDGAHNPSAWQDLHGWMQQMGLEKVNVLCSLSKGRDPEVFLEKVGPIKKRVYLWQAGFEKELPASCWPKDVVRIQEASLSRLLEKPLLVTGSLYLIGAFKVWLNKNVN